MPTYCETEPRLAVLASAGTLSRTASFICGPSHHGQFATACFCLSDYIHSTLPKLCIDSHVPTWDMGKARPVGLISGEFRKQCTDVRPPCKSLIQVLSTY